MPYQTTGSDRQGIEDSHAEELQHWLDRVHDLPDVRMDEVVAMRDALRKGSYPSEAALDEAISRLTQDITLLCRSDFEGDEADCPGSTCHGA